jgi:hypothetical protein
MKGFPVISFLFPDLQIDFVSHGKLLLFIFG